MRFGISKHNRQSQRQQDFVGPPSSGHENKASLKSAVPHHGSDRGLCGLQEGTSMRSKIVALAAAVAIGTATMTTGAMAFHAGGDFGGGGGLRRSRRGNGRRAFRGMAMHGAWVDPVSRISGTGNAHGRTRRRYLPRRGQADRHAAIRVAAVHLHRVRVDVLPDRRAVCIGALPKHPRP
jgi:hypothetical protein